MALTVNRKRAVRRLLVALTLSLGLLACQPATPMVGSAPAPTSTPPPTTHAKPSSSSAAAAAADARWRATVEFAAAVEDAKWRAIVEFAAAVEAARLAELNYPSGLCGGDLPPCWVLNRESKGDIRIWNGRCYAPFGWTGPRAPNCPNAESSASGKWQGVRRSWKGFGGFLNAADAPERVQDAWARQLWAGGRGCSHWSACGRR